MRDTVPAPAHVWSTGHFGFFTSQDTRWRKPHPRSKGQSRNKLLLIDVKAEKPEHQARRGHPTLPYRRSAGRRRSRIISCLTKGIEEGQRRRQVRGSHCPLTLSPQPASSLLSQICFRRAAQRSNSLRDTEPGAARAQKCPVERWKEQQLLPSSHVLRVTCIHRSNFVAISLK